MVMACATKHAKFSSLFRHGGCHAGGQSIYESIYEYEYYQSDTDFNADYSLRRLTLPSCPGFELFDYDVEGSSEVSILYL